MTLLEKSRPESPDAKVPPLRRNRDFLLLWAGAGASFLGSRVSLIAYPLLVVWLTGSARDAGLVGAAANLPYLIAQLPAGALVDRWDRRKLMIACDAGRILAIGTVAAAVFLDRVYIPHLVVVAFLESTLTIAYRLAERAAVRHVVAPAQLPAALAQNEARERAAGLLGQPVGALLFSLVRWSPFLFTAVAHLLSLVMLLLVRKPFQGERAPRTGNLYQEVREGIVFVWRQRFMRAAAGLIAGSNMLFQALSLALIVIVKEQGGTGATVALILVVSGVGGGLGALSASWLMRRLSVPALVIASNVAWALLMPAVALVDGPVALGALFAAMGFAGALWNVAAAVYQMEITPEHMIGRVTSVATLVAFGTLPLGSLLAGFLLESLGTRTTVLTLSAGMAVLAVAAIASPSIRKAAHDTA
ncbi:MFS transporter [Streptomyces xanthophaeus]|uniref:MFS transporter n=1 Tax=Streptomyces xanthophaeus TaxID=67385 RepID=UPI0026499E2E|nr:MFS transporter [Streptomyces xanthophaeus]WKD32117.1 MFS transporter [Streptomyces xanthophaeus]